MTRGERPQFPTPRNYWMFVTTLENYRITRDHGFHVQGFSTAQRKKTERMEVGDRLLYYLSNVKRFAATATVSSKYFEDHAPLWVPDTEGETYPYRVHVVPQMVLEEGEFLDALELAPRLQNEL